uniref:Calx-beta domain-containing protein n=1 Tax=Ciona intestinalis TaxID=7719 RepID=H2XSK5_CIOIN
RGFIYIIAIAYLFIGVAIGSDVFMTSIEVITSKKRTIIIWDEELGENTKKEVLVWNETVANLTLLALGSSAPEILLATVETINEILSGNQAKGGGLGFYTIVGSAAFNLLVITGICIISVPSPSHKSIRELGVFILTSMWSLLAYVWLLCVMLWTSPNVVEPWEAWLTLIFFPLLVITAYAQDNGWWMYKLRGQNSVQDASKPRDEDPAERFGSRGEIAREKSKNELDKVRLAFYVFWHETIKLTQRESDHDTFSPKRCSCWALKSMSKPNPIFYKQQLTAIELASISKKDNGRKEDCQYNFDCSRIMLTTADINRKQTFEYPVKLIIVQSNHKIFTLCADESSGNVAFASSAYSTLESAGELTIDVLLHRRKSVGVISVDYETREGTAKINKDFKYTSGTLIFPEDTYVQSISIPIINDDQYYPDTDFYVILKNPSGDATLGDPSVSRVTIIDDDKPGDFVLETSQLYADMEKGEVSATVLRQCGSDGVVFVHYATIDGTAHGGETMDLGVDYVHTSGKLEFKHQETSKVITIEINKDITVNKNKRKALKLPFFAIKQNGKNAVTVYKYRLPFRRFHPLNKAWVKFTNDLTYTSALALFRFLPTSINSMSRVLIDENDTTWVGQIRNTKQKLSKHRLICLVAAVYKMRFYPSAMIVGGEMDDYGNESPPSNTDFLMHAISMPWKIVFALAPTRHAYGGFPAFIISLLMIGCLTAIIEQLGHLLGCVATLKTQVTGITIIALGTSLPDTIASRTAALQDDYADASIGNITGSNSVNVFLGLGLPWVIRTMYFAVKGGQYIVDTDGLDFAVTLFDSFGAVCVVLLILRRYVLGGELGGSTRVKWASGIFLFTLWFIFIIVSSLKAYNYF